MTPADSALAALAELGAATVYEANRQRGALDPAPKPLDPTTRIAGTAVTVALEPADNWYLHVALLHAAPGDLLVVDAQGDTDPGTWGDVLTLAVQHRGLAGLIIDGAVRDSRQIIESGFPVFTRGICIRKTSKIQPGTINTPVTVGGVLINPGDILVGDADGLVRLDPGDITAALDGLPKHAAAGAALRPVDGRATGRPTTTRTPSSVGTPTPRRPSSVVKLRSFMTCLLQTLLRSPGSAIG